ERLADADNELHRLGRLNHAHQARKHAEHAAFGAAGHETRRRRLRIPAAIAGAIGQGQHRGLSFKAENAGVDVGYAAEHAGVVDQVARWEIVGAVHDQIVAAEDLERVLAGELGFVADDLDAGADGLQAFARAIQLGPADVGGGLDHLPLEVGEIHYIKIHDADGADAGGREIKSDRSAEASGADGEHFGGLELALALDAYLRNDEVAAVAQDLLVAEFSAAGRSNRGRHEKCLHRRHCGAVRSEQGLSGEGNYRQAGLNIGTRGSRRRCWGRWKACRKRSQAFVRFQYSEYLHRCGIR